MRNGTTAGIEKHARLRSHAAHVREGLLSGTQLPSHALKLRVQLSLSRHSHLGGRF